MNNQAIGSERWELPQFFNDAVNIINIVATEGYATLRHILPASLAWVWRKYITNEIKTIPLQVTAGKVTRIAYLNIHGNCQFEKNCRPVLLTHGDYGHPYSMLHLADMAQKEHPVFSLYIPGVENNTESEIHDCLLKESINKIEAIINENQGHFEGILGVGHSKGAILLARRQFVLLDPTIIATCSLSGRLNAPTDNDCSNPIIRKIVRSIYEGVVQNPTLPLMQIIPKDDWNASYESMAVRPHKHCHTVPGMHLSGIYTQEAKSHFKDFLTF